MIYFYPYKNEFGGIKMAKLKVSDFYYGAVLSLLFNKGINPALVEGDSNRQVYDISTDKGDFRLFIKYRADKQDIKTEDYNSWTFQLTQKDKSEIVDYMNNNYNLIVALLCGVEGLADSEIVILDKNKIKEILDLQKSSITVSRKKHERAFRISVGGGRDNAMKIKTNRFDELLLS
jgi:predicted nucleic-acid-binding Zn-ribbon protein